MPRKAWLYDDINEPLSPVMEASAKALIDILNKNKPRGSKMRTQHTTKDGNVMSIASMESEHLFNTINLSVKKLEVANNLINKSKKKTADNVIYGTGFDSEDAEQYIEDFRDIIAPYLVEAVIRGLDLLPVTEKLQGIFERKDKRTEVLDCFLLEEGE